MAGIRAVASGTPTSVVSIPDHAVEDEKIDMISNLALKIEDEQ